MLWLLVLGAAVPSLAALLVCSSSRPSQLRKLLNRLRPIGRDTPWRVAFLSYGSLVVLVVAGLLAVYALRSVLPGPQYFHPPELTGASVVAALLMAAFLDQGGVLEELGWRGYALPELQAGLATPLRAAVLLGTGWALWHVPRDVVAGVIDRLGFVSYLLLYLPAFVASMVAVSVIAAYFANRLGGSIIPAIMVHGLSNDAVGLSGVATMGSVLSPYYQATRAVPFALIAALLIGLGGRDLGLATGGRPTRRCTRPEQPS